MAKEVLLNPRILLGGYELTGDLSQVALIRSADIVDKTTFASQGARENMGGLLATAWQAEGLWEPQNADKALYDNLGLTDVPVSLVPQPAVEGGLAYLIRAIAAEYAPKATVGEAFRFSAGGQGRSPCARGIMVARRVATAVDSASAPLQLGALSATQRLLCAWHLFDYQGSGTINATVYSDNAVGFGTPTARGSFVGRTSIGAEVIEIAGPITDDYWAFDWSFAGGPPTVSFAAVFGIV